MNNSRKNDGKAPAQTPLSISARLAAEAKAALLWTSWLTGGGVSHGLEGHDPRILWDDGPVEVAEAVHVLGGVLEVPGKRVESREDRNETISLTRSETAPQRTSNPMARKNVRTEKLVTPRDKHYETDDMNIEYLLRSTYVFSAARAMGNTTWRGCCTPRCAMPSSLFETHPIPPQNPVNNTNTKQPTPTRPPGQQTTQPNATGSSPKAKEQLSSSRKEQLRWKRKEKNNCQPTKQPQRATTAVAERSRGAWQAPSPHAA